MVNVSCLAGVLMVMIWVIDLLWTDDEESGLSYENTSWMHKAFAF